MAGSSIRAFSDPKYTYYRLTKDLGNMKAGEIFYHDPDDHICGSFAEGCLKNCWTADGDCSSCGVCGGTVIFHVNFAKTDLFEVVSWSHEEFLKSLTKGKYTLVIDSDGKWSVSKLGDVS